MKISEELFETALANSYKNFHAKGFDYLCLKRTPELTEKVYFFRGQADSLHDVVNPHNHRYDFYTKCLAGTVVNHEWMFTTAAIDPSATRYHAFKYNTPLNGGEGFRYAAETLLAPYSSDLYSQGETYWMHYDEIHTISIGHDTVIKLWQFEDKVPVGDSTVTFTKNPDSLLNQDDGLYEKFTADELLKRFHWLEEIDA